jgi:hypothetical protein
MNVVVINNFVHELLYKMCQFTAAYNAIKFPENSNEKLDRF